MKVLFNDIFHLERFSVGDKEFIKDTSNPAKGNARHWSGKRDYVSLSPETPVQRKRPDVARFQG